MLEENDFGFTFVDATQIAEMNNLKPSSDYDALKKKFSEDLDKLEKLVLPLLNNLLKSPEQEYIHWKDRETPIRNQIAKITKITQQFK